MPPIKNMKTTLDRLQEQYDHKIPNDDDIDDHDCKQDGHSMKKIKSKKGISLLKCQYCNYEDYDCDYD